MKGLFLFIKNNRIIYKVSIVSVLILMLISVVQINPDDKKEKKTVSGEKVYNYYLKYDASVGKMYRVTSDSDALTSDNEITNSDLSGWEVVDEAGKKVLVLKGLNFVTSKNNALVVEGDSTIRLQEGTVSRIQTTNNNAGCTAIQFIGNADIEGENGELLIESNGSYSAGSTNCGILTYYPLNIKSGKLDIKCTGHSLYGINSSSNVILNSSDNIDINLIGIAHIGIQTQNLEINGTKLNMNLSSNYSGYGIKAENDMTVNKGNICIDMETNNINDGISVDLLEFYKNNRRIIVVKNMYINGGNIEAKCQNNVMTGITCTGNYEETAGRVCLELGNQNDVVGLNCTGTISITDGTLEVDATNAMNKAPTIIAENVSISEYILQSDSTNTLKYTGADVANIPSYSHVIIEPNYFFQYSNGKLYKITVTDDLAREVTDMPTGMSIDDANNTITLDGFVFTTSKRMGLYTKNDIKINLADNSKNIISTKLDIANAGGSICGIEDNKNMYFEANINCSGSNLTLEGNGDLYLSGNVIANETTSRFSSCMGIRANNFTMNGGNLDIECKAVDEKGKYQAKSIFCEASITIKGGNIDAYAFGAISRGISSDGTITIPSSYTGNIHSICKGTDLHNISGDKGVSILGGNIILKNELGDDHTTPPDSYGIYAYNNDDNLDTITIGTKDSGNRVNLEIYSNHRGNSRVIYAHGHIMINNSAINIISNTNHGVTAITEGDYGIYSSEQYLSIEDSDINIKAKLKNTNDKYITGVCASKNVNIKNTSVDINMDSKSCEGVLSRYNDIKIDNSNISIKTVDNTINKISIRGIKSPEGNIIMTSSSTDIDINGQDCEGIETQAGDMTINNCDTIKIKVYTNGDNRNSGIRVNGCVTINDSTVIANNTESANSGYGIYCSNAFSVSNSTITAQGKKGAIYLSYDPTIIGKTEASPNYDGTGKTSVTLNSSNCLSYPYVYITPNKVISVDITWGAMDYTYEQTGWNPLTHTYATEGWKVNGADNDKITVNNSNSNCKVTATITYNPVTEYNGIKGTILTDKINNTVLTSPTVLQPGSVEGNSVVAYLKLNNKPSTTLSTTTIGNVTVTIEEVK